MMSKSSLQHSLAAQILTVVFSLYFLVTLTLTLGQMLAEYQEARATIGSEMSGLHQAFEPILGQMLWDFNLEGVQSILEGMRKAPVVLGGKVITINSHVIEAGAVGPSQEASGEVGGMFAQRFEIQYVYGQEVRQVGTLILYSDASVIWGRVRQSYGLIVLNAILKTVALWLIFLWVGRERLTLPLAALTQATRRLNLDNLEHFHWETLSPRQNELKTLEEAFRAMTQQLLTAKERLLSLQRLSVQWLAHPDPEAGLRALFQEASQWIRADAAFWVKAPGQQLVKYRESHPQAAFLREGFPSEWLLPHFLGQPPEVRVLNARPAHPAEVPWESPEALAAWPGSHLLIFRPHEHPEQLLGLWRSASREGFDSAEATYVQSLLLGMQATRERLAIVREQARMLNELNTAAAVQRALFPKSLPRYEHLELASFFESASETGGDWYGFLTQIEGQLYLMIGDVTGHGTPAALVVSAVGATCRMLERGAWKRSQAPAPSELLEELNEAVFRVGAPDFLMTFFVGKLDLSSGVLTFANAGHNFPLVWHSEGSIRYLLNANQVLGRQLRTVFQEAEITLNPGDRLLFFTDGLIENRNAEEEAWGQSRLTRLLKSLPAMPPQETLRRVIGEAYRFYGGRPLQDDVTALLCEFSPLWKPKR